MDPRTGLDSSEELLSVSGLEPQTPPSPQLCRFTNFATSALTLTIRIRKYIIYVSCLFQVAILHHVRYFSYCLFWCFA